MGKIAVLGAGGFVGARLIEMTVASGARNLVPVIRSFKSLARLSKLGVEYRRGDVSSVESLKPAISGCDMVLNLTTGDPLQMASNAKAICDACEAEKIRLLIHISSAEVFGSVESPHINDDSPPNLKHWMAYARGKGQAEVILQREMRRAPFAIVVLRPGLIWGPRSSWAVGAAKDLMEERAFLVNKGSGICNLMFVDNLIHSMLGITRQSTWPSGFYNVGDDEEVTWANYYGELARHLNFDIHKITAFPPSKYVPTLKDHLRELRQTKTMRWVNGIMPSEVRVVVEKLVRRALGLLNPNKPGISQQPRVTRSLWNLQLTRHKLPTDKFRKTFGKHHNYSFQQATEMTCSWLRFAGCALPLDHGRNES